MTHQTIPLEAALDAQIERNAEAIQAAADILAESSYTGAVEQACCDLLGMSSAEIDAWLLTIPRTHWDELDAYCEQIGLAESGRW